MKDIISFRWQTEYFKSFFKANNAYNEASITYTKRSANENRIFNAMIEAASLDIKAVVVLLIIRGDLSLLWLIPMFILSSAIFGPIQEALAMSTNYGMIFGAAERLFKLFQMKPKIYVTGTKTVSDAFVSADADNTKRVTIEKLPEGFSTIVGERGIRLSGGEKQRLSIAQAFLKNSPVLILDEASANLDSENERLINTAINKLKEGRATMVIAHRISTIKNADRIVFIEDGRVCGDGTYNELVKTCPNFVKLIGNEYEN